MGRWESINEAQYTVEWFKAKEFTIQVNRHFIEKGVTIIVYRIEGPDGELKPLMKYEREKRTRSFFRYKADPQ